MLSFPWEHCPHCGAEFEWGKSGQLGYYDDGAVYICYTCGTECVDKADTFTIVVHKSDQKVEQVAPLKKKQKLRKRVKVLEDWCELLDERITMACSILNLE